jgi:hypothetical protein
MLCKSKLGYRTLHARWTYRVKVVDGPEVGWVVVVVSIQSVLTAPIPIGGLPILLG